MEGGILTWLIVAYIGGVVVSIVWPFLLAWIENQEPFDWRMNVGRILTALIGALPLLANQEFLAQLGAMSYVAAFVYGMGASAIGRYAQKTPGAVTKALRA